MGRDLADWTVCDTFSAGLFSIVGADSHVVLISHLDETEAFLV